MVHVKNKTNLSVEITDGRHTIISDVSDVSGGNDVGFNPHELLEASLGACTSITVMMYGRRKGWPLKDVQVMVKVVEEKDVNHIRREVTLVGDLNEEQKERLMDIANKCPMHNFLIRKSTIETVIV